ncbi:MAG: GNAT family N-acetyltransferase [Anaerolineales bacterium]|jgi:CelD/BcsL family acetyltransferase involved in cellulose biosynthesis
MRGYSISKVKATRDRFAELEGLTESARHSIHMNSAWLARYTECFQRERSAFILEARESESGRLAGALPLEVRAIPAAAGWSTRRLVPLGSGPADFNLILCLPGGEAQVAALVTRWLVKRRQQWESLRMDLVPQSSRGWQEFVYALKGSGLSPSVSQERYFYKVDTSGNWDDYQKGFLRGHLDDLRNRMNRLARERGETEVRIIEKGIQDHLEGFLTCYRQRRKATGQKDHFATEPGRLRFLESVIRDFEQKKMARLSLLKSGEDVLAYQLDWVHEGIWYHYMPTYNELYAKYSPGRILLLETLRLAFEDPEIREFNFMRGQEAYKAQFANQKEAFISIRVTNPWSLRGKAISLLSRLATLRERGRSLDGNG